MDTDLAEAKLMAKYAHALACRGAYDAAQAYAAAALALALLALVQALSPASATVAQEAAAEQDAR